MDPTPQSTRQWNRFPSNLKIPGNYKQLIEVKIEGQARPYLLTKALEAGRTTFKSSLAQRNRAWKDPPSKGTQVLFGDDTPKPSFAMQQKEGSKVLTHHQHKDLKK